MSNKDLEETRAILSIISGNAEVMLRLSPQCYERSLCEIKNKIARIDKLIKEMLLLREKRNDK